MSTSSPAPSHPSLHEILATKLHKARQTNHNSSAVRMRARHLTTSAPSRQANKDYDNHADSHARSKRNEQATLKMMNNNNNSINSYRKRLFEFEDNISDDFDDQQEEHKRPLAGERLIDAQTSETTTTATTTTATAAVETRLTSAQRPQDDIETMTSRCKPQAAIGKRARLRAARCQDGHAIISSPLSSPLRLSVVLVCLGLALVQLVSGGGSGSGTLSQASSSTISRLNNKQASSSSSSSNNNVQMLIKSADVELSRSRGLQRLQRDASTSSAAIISSPSAIGGSSMMNSTAVAPPAPTCGYPGSPAHASVTFNTSHVQAGTAASYTCDNGYELLGPPRRICQASGSWAPIGIPFCGK